MIDHQVTCDADHELHEAIRAKLGNHRTVTRALETTYFDAAHVPLYTQGAMLRARGRVGRRKRKVEAKVRSGGGVQRLSGAEATAAAERLAGGHELKPVATQIKHRTLILMPGGRSRIAPDFVVALDRARVDARCGSSERHEVELQIFTALPWTAKVDDARVERFADFCRTTMVDFGLVQSARSGYQAIPKEVLS